MLGTPDDVRNSFQLEMANQQRLHGQGKHFAARSGMIGIDFSFSRCFPSDSPEHQPDEGRSDVSLASQEGLYDASAAVEDVLAPQIRHLPMQRRHCVLRLERQDLRRKEDRRSRFVVSRPPRCKLTSSKTSAAGIGSSGNVGT